tara:strand:+ start:1534 stop:4416 length:2883 start_codon:yes stop_codon:yes gene_type:complete
MGFSLKGFIKNLTKPETIIQAVVMAAVSGPIGFTQAFAISVAKSAALSAAVQSLAPKPDLGGFGDFANLSNNRTQMIRQPTFPRRAIYGEARISGVLAHVESTQNDKFLHLVICLANHEVNRIGTPDSSNTKGYFINDEEITLDSNGNCISPSKFANKIRIYSHLGDDNQAADSNLVSESSNWTDQHRLQGIAYIYARLEFDRNAFANGLPNISVKVQGKKIFDPRNSSTSYSTNPALCIRDYLINTRFGLGAPTNEINDTDFTTAANICDETVNLKAGGSETKYTFNGTVESTDSVKSNLEKMITSLGGILSYSNGKFSLKAAKFVSPSMNISEDDLVGNLSVSTKKSKRDNFNSIKGIFASTETNFVPADYPTVTSSTFINEDGEQIFLNYDLPFTTSSATAQRLAKIQLFQNRQQVMLQIGMNLKGFKLAIGDTIQFTNTKLGMTNKIFEVVEWNLQTSADDIGINVALRETASSVYDWTESVDEASFQQDNTTLPDPFTIEAPSLSVSDELQVFNEKALSVLVAQPTSASVYADQFEVEAKKTTDANFIAIGTSASNKFELVDVEDSVTYDVRARVVSSIGVTSAFTTVQHQVVGKTALPSDVTNFSVNIIGTEAHLAWTPVSDLDLSHYVIRHSSSTSGATYSNSVTLAEKVSRPANTVVVPAITGTYFIKSIDKLGNNSLNASSQVALIESIKGLNAVATSTQNPDFNGAKTNVAAVEDGLVLSTQGLFDAATGNFDDATGLFDGGADAVHLTGTYEFDNFVDLGQVFTSRVSTDISVTRVEYADLFDSATGLFDDGIGNFDGDVQAFDDTNVEIQIATTEGDPNGSPTYTDFRKFFAGDYKARAFKFKAILTTTSTTASPKVGTLKVTIDMPDRVIAESDLSSGTGTKTITFSPAYKTLSGIGITAQNLSSGDYYAITSKSATGFTIQFFNSSNAGVNRTFDYVAKGFGEVAA